MSSIAQQLALNNCALIKNFISADMALALAEDFVQAKTNNLLDYDSSYIGHVCYNFPSFLKLLVNKTTEVSELIEDDVLPTYTYARIYSKGGKLVRHTDRPSCEVSLTLNLKHDAKWLIFAEAPDGTAISFDLEPGDAMIYHGCDAPHWREGEYTGEEYTQLFLHYVRMNGPRGGYYFDRIR